MAQNTLVVKLLPEEQRAFEDRLNQGDFDYRPVDHARFSARGEGVVATLYESGKLVVQGRELDVFAARYLDRVEAAPPESDGDSAPAQVMIGSDETGKGDYFGPLVVVAFKLRADERAGLRKSGIMDSKRMADERIRQLAPTLEDRFEHAIETLEPPEYNEAHARVKNLNPMLADLHAKAIRRIAEPGADVLVDQFANEKLLRERLSNVDISLRQMPRAEREMAVAAASVIARFVFLERMAELSEEFAVDLAKGAGAPTDRAARRFVAIHGFEALSKVAKLHFKNTQKLAQGRG